MFGRKKKKEAQAKTGAPAKQSQLAVVKDAYKLVKKDSPFAIIWCLLVFVLIITFGVIIGNNLGHPIYAGFLSLPLGFLAAFFLFTRYANTAAFSSIEGQIGAGASVLMSIRRGFVTTPAVKHLKKLPKKLNTVQLREVRARLKSVGGLNLPMPKGPMPTNVRMPRR